MQKRINIFLKNNPDEWIVIPIPLHRRKELERGFNQNDILTTTCFDSHLTILIGKSNPLKRTKYTQSQTQFKGAERVANIKQSFKVIDESKVKNKNIILVDDVLTTGATLREAALTLCQVGARRVWGFVLAKD
jgi:ComF family protein